MSDISWDGLSCSDDFFVCSTLKTFFPPSGPRFFFVVTNLLKLFLSLWTCRPCLVTSASRDWFALCSLSVLGTFRPLIFAHFRDGPPINFTFLPNFLIYPPPLALRMCPRLERNRVRSFLRFHCTSFFRFACGEKLCPWRIVDCVENLPLSYFCGPITV